MQYSNIIHKKIFTVEAIKPMLAYWRFKNKKIVFTNGCFDVLHVGHAQYLSQAADLGHVLIVGLNTDASVKRLKGSERPINPEKARQFLLASMLFVDAVVLFDEDTPLKLIEAILPDILVKGSDYKPEEIVGYDIVTKNGGEVKTIDLVKGFSTTNLLQKMK